MFSIRSHETLQKERELQDRHTVLMNLEIQRRGDDTYRRTLEDAAVFANFLRADLPDKVTVVLHERPKIIIEGEGNGYTVSIYLTRNCGWFKVNGSTHMELEGSEIVGPGRLLLILKKILVDKLPENYILRGILDPNDPEEETATRSALEQKLGWGSIQPNGEVYGVVQNKTIKPLTLDQFLELTKITPRDLDQDFSVKKINWPGA